MQKVKVRGTELRMKRVDSKPDKPKFSGKSKRPDRLPAEFRDERPANKPRAYEGTPRFSSDAPRRDSEGAPQRFADYARGDSPRPGGKPPFKSGGFKKPFTKPFTKPFKKPFKKAGPKARKD